MGRSRHGQAPERDGLPLRQVSTAHEGPPMTGTPPRLPSMFEQFMSAATSATAAKAEEQRQPWPSNPFPKGIRDGSATELILEALKEAHPRWLEHWELMRITGRSRGAIAWGMRYLGERGMVRSIQSARHPSWRRYQAVKPASDEP